MKNLMLKKGKQPNRMDMTPFLFGTFSQEQTGIKN